jgi:hypothetical protein
LVPSAPADADRRSDQTAVLLEIGRSERWSLHKSIEIARQRLLANEES